MLPAALPEPSLLLPGQGEPSLRWGIVGTGWIADFFVKAVRAHTSQRVVAVATRTAEKATDFATRHSIERVHKSADALVMDPGVDVVYVAAPQSEHLRLGLLATAAGKHALIEKPLATSAADAKKLLAAAGAAGVLVMEAMWSRYQPQAELVRRIIAEGIIGDVMLVHADHGQPLADNPNHRVLVPGSGGALLELGIYPIQLDSMVLGAPDTVRAVGSLTDSGVDATSTLTLTHGREQSTIATSILTRTPTVAAICGTKGRIEIQGPFHVPREITVRSHDHFEPPLFWRDTTGISLMDALSWQATALAGYVAEGRRESPLHTHAETISILATIDEARRQLGAR